MESNLPTTDKIQELQRKLYLKAKSEANFRFYALYDKIYRKDVLERAWERVRSNHGASGIDGKSIEDIKKTGVDEFLKKIQEELRTEEYRPQPARRVYIPKPDGRQRPLSIPTIKDRVVQMAVKIVIEPIFEAGFENNSYGFRPKRSTQQAVNEIHKYLNYGLTNVIDSDLEDCFGSIPHQELLNMVAQNCVIKGKRSNWDSLPPDKSLFHSAPNCGLPIGNLTSQVFANFFMDTFDHYIKHDLGIHYYSRYVDDFVIMHNDKEYLRSLIPNFTNFLLSTLQLTLHSRKIYFQHYTKGVKFLGAVIKPYRIYIANRTKGNFYEAIEKQNKIARNHKSTKDEQGKFLGSMNSYLSLS
ncbi:MAG: reverse transcriptase domain-containing protein [Nitrospirota bacterium]